MPAYEHDTTFSVPEEKNENSHMHEPLITSTAIGFFLNNQPDALIIQILFCYKTLHVSGIFSAHHQEFSTLHSALVSFVQVYDDRFQAESGQNCLEAVTKNLHETYQCRMYSRELLMMGREDARNMWSLITESIWIISASGWLFKKKSITMHGNMNVKFTAIGFTCP
jgi:hypothetical protein